MIWINSEAQNTDDANRSKIKSTSKAILADECREYMRRMYEVNDELLTLLLPVLRFASINLESPVDIFFIDVVPVTPAPSRPANKTNGTLCEHPQTTVYKNIINANSTLRAITIVMRLDDNDDASTKPDIEPNVLAGYRGIYEQSQGASPYEKMYNAWQELQTNIDQTWDKNMATEKIGVGLKQVIFLNILYIIHCNSIKKYLLGLDYREKSRYYSHEHDGQACQLRLSNGHHARSIYKCG